MRIITFNIEYILIVLVKSFQKILPDIVLNCIVDLRINNFCLNFIKTAKVIHKALFHTHTSHRKHEGINCT